MVGSPDIFLDSNEFGDNSENYHVEFLETIKTPKPSTQRVLQEKPILYQSYRAEASNSHLSTANATLPNKTTSELSTANAKFIYKTVPATTSTIKKHTNMVDSLDNFLDSNEFGEDDSENYHFEFLKTIKQPKTSTQKILHEKPHLYHPCRAEASISQFSTANAKLPNKSVPATTSTITNHTSQLLTENAKLPKFIYKTVPGTTSTITNHTSQLLTENAKLPKFIYKTVPATTSTITNHTSKLLTENAKLPKFIYKTIPSTTSTITESVDQTNQTSINTCNFVAPNINESHSSTSNIVCTQCVKN